MKKTITLVLLILCWFTDEVQAQLTWARILRQDEGRLEFAVDERILVARKDSILSISTDGGATWSVSGKLPTFNTYQAPNVSQVEELAFMSWRSALEGTIYSKLINYNPAGIVAKSIAYETTDGGMSWSGKQTQHRLPITWVVESSDLSVSFSPFYVYDPEWWEPSTLIIKTPTIDTIIIAPTTTDVEVTPSGLLFTSGGFGQSSTVRRENLETGKSDTITSITSAPTFLGGQSFVGYTQNDIKFSHDNGDTWENSSLPPGLRYVGNRKLTVFAYDSLTLFKSVDGAKTWTEISGWHPYYWWGDWRVLSDSVIYVNTPQGTFRTVTADVTLSVDAIHEPLSGVYPNPASIEVTVATKARWFNVVGEEIFPAVEETGGGYQYDVRALPRGVYVLRSDDRVSKVILH